MLLALLWLASPSAHADPQPVGVAASGKYLLWNNIDNTNNGAVCLAINTSGTYSYYTYGPYPAWSAKALATGTDGVARILWTKTDGSAALWRVDSSGGFTQTTYGPFSGWFPQSLAVGGDNVPRIMWTYTDGTMSLWSVDAQGGYTYQNFGPYSGYTVYLIAVGANNVPRILWYKTDDSISLWNGLSGTPGYSHTEYGPFSGYTPISLAADSGNAVRLLWDHPSDSTTSLWNLPPSGGYTYQNYTNPVGTSPAVVSADLSGAAGTAQVLYGQGDGTAKISFLNGATQVSAGTVAPPGASNGGGGGGNTTPATPNPHGSYVLTGYSGGTLTSSDGTTTTPQNGYGNDFGASSYGGSATVVGVYNGSSSAPYVSAKITGPVYAKFHWTPDADHPNSLPPSQVTVIERCKVSWTLYDPNNGLSGTFNTGLSPSRSSSAYTSGDSVSGIGGVTVSSPGADFQVSCSPSATVSGYSSFTCSRSTLAFSFTASAVTMNLAGTTPDTSGVDNILIGQVCKPSLNIPAGLLGSTTYAWKASGTRFKSWDVTYTAGKPQVDATPTTPATPAVPPTSTSTPSPSPDLITDAMPTWYWNEVVVNPHTKIETIICTATVTPPPGQGAAFTLTAPIQSVIVQVPAWTATGHGGSMQVNASDTAINGYALYAGPKPGTGEIAGMSWEATVAAHLGSSFGDGSLILVQTVNPHRTYTTQDAAGTISKYDWSINDKTLLDTSVIYPWAASQPDSASYSTNDSPGTPLPANKASASISDRFDDYLMYIAPGSSQAQAVPLAHFVWNATANNVIKPSTSGGWSDYGAKSAGTVTISTGLAPGATPLPGDPAQSFEAWHDYPIWTQVADVNYSPYIKATP